MQDDIVRPPQPPQAPQAGPVVQPVPEAEAPQKQPTEAPTSVKTPESPPQTPVPVPKPPKKPKKASPVGIIIVAVVVFLALAGTAIYIKMNQKDDTPTTKTPAVSAPTTSASQNSDVLDTAIEGATTLQNDTPDPATDLTDAALGL